MAITKVVVTEIREENVMQKLYYTLCVKEFGRWSPDFGSYDRYDVEEERNIRTDSHDMLPMVILQTDDNQSAIMNAVEILNLKGY